MTTETRLVPITALEEIHDLREARDTILALFRGGAE